MAKPKMILLQLLGVLAEKPMTKGEITIITYQQNNYMEKL
jgi:hypothetical protein